MSYRLVIDGNSVYEIDEDFERYRENRMGGGNGKRSRKPEEKAQKRVDREDEGETGSRRNGQKKAGRTSARPPFGSYGSAAEEAAVSPAAAAAEKQDDPDAAAVKAASAAAAASTVISTSAMSAAAAEKDEDPENVAVAPASTSAGRIVGVASASAICSC